MEYIFVVLISGHNLNSHKTIYTLHITIIYISTHNSPSHTINGTLVELVHCKLNMNPKILLMLQS
jgi:hypothetical protein